MVETFFKTLKSELVWRTAFETRADAAAAIGDTSMASKSYPPPFRPRLHLTGAGTPRELQARLSACIAVIILPNGCPMLLLIVVAGDQTAAIAVSFRPEPQS